MTYSVTLYARASDEKSKPPVLDDLTSHVNHSYLKRYTTKRDEYHAQVDDPRDGTRYQPCLGLWGLPKEEKRFNKFKEAPITMASRTELPEI